ncbi:phosphate ABC transporter permease PstA [Jiangella alkaliphila]|uniref:Phosphate transport system permease protein PstA n=1 Tax=Jiangella alkaliphila TaxID=419479 RepID=A0A1H2LJ11_9ACTN|nr:phosphate ABC transporter permease PstA [Jiangella alkaliphila]SDU81023.1 phosphate transport system permease protein [Jiangella alkaliphila]
MTALDTRNPGPVTDTPSPGGTTLPPPVSPGGPEETRRNLVMLRTSDVFALLGAMSAALAITFLLFTQLLPIDGGIGFVIIAYVLFLVIYALLVSLDEDGPAVRDKVAAVAVHGIAVLLGMALVFVVVYTIARGLEALPNLNFYTEDMRSTGPLDPLTQGGIVHGLVGTLIMISIALAITIPLGVTCAVFLTEIPGRFSRLVRTICEAMTALPSIVAGLFIYATWITMLGFDQSGFAAGLAITVMMLPIVIRAADVVLRLVPGTLKEASYAAGAGQWRTVWHVTLPTARSGLMTSLILGTARGIGETSPVLLTAGFTTAMNTDPFNEPMVSMPLLVFDSVKNPQPEMIARGFGTAAALMVLVLVLFAVGRAIGGRGPGQLTRRQQHRRVLASRRDAERFRALEAARPQLATNEEGKSQ